jgi:hypothetical protein
MMTDDLKNINNPPTLDQLTSLWEKTIDVQMHFNDLQLRVRNFAILLISAFVGGFGAAMKENFFVHVALFNIPISSLILAFAALVWLAFYFMDTLWYHPLLIGSVMHGMVLEGEIKKLTGLPGLTDAIKKSSPVRIPVIGIEIHSKHKSHVFYLFIFSILLALSLVLGFAGNISNQQSGDISKILSAPDGATAKSSFSSSAAIGSKH